MGAVLGAVITSVIVPTFYIPYINFKQELIATNRYLQLHCNILTGKFQRDLIFPEFEKKVNEAQYDIRTSWVNLESKYLLIPSLTRSVLIELKTLPTKKDLEDVYGELKFISNSKIIFDKVNSDQAEFEFKRRKVSIPKVQQFIYKYIS